MKTVPRKPRFWLDRLKLPLYAVSLGSALVVGLGAGLGAVAFRRLITAVTSFNFGSLEPGGWWNPWLLLLVPAAGGLVGGILTRIAPEARGPGTQK